MRKSHWFKTLKALCITSFKRTAKAPFSRAILKTHIRSIMFRFMIWKLIKSWHSTVTEITFSWWIQTTSFTIYLVKETKVNVDWLWQTNRLWRISSSLNTYPKTMIHSILVIGTAFLDLRYSISIQRWETHFLKESWKQRIWSIRSLRNQMANNIGCEDHLSLKDQIDSIMCIGKINSERS